MSPIITRALATSEVWEARARITAKIDMRSAEECWHWHGSLNAAGYGIVRAAGRTLLAHRVAYALFRGDIPEGITVDHRCGTPACVNPSHLELVTHEENLRRSTRGICAEHAKKTKCPRGHDYAIYHHKSNGRTQRYCPTCKREKGREWMRRRRGSDPARYRV